MTTRHRFRRASLALTGWLALSLPLGGAAVAQTAEGTDLFVDRIDIDVVNVEVVVTDRDGNRIAGLEADDFELYENGEPVEITNFYAAAGEDRVLSGLDRDRDMVAGEVVELAPVPEDQRLHLAVYIDHFNLSPAGQTTAIQQLEAFLTDRIFQGDRVMLMGHDGSGVDTVTGFTEDPAEISRGLAELARQATHRQVVNSQLRETMRNMRAPAADPTDPQARVRDSYAFVRSYVAQINQEVQRSTEALGTAIKSLSGVPGRRALVYVGEGMEQRPGEELYQFLQDLYGLELVMSIGVNPILEPAANNQAFAFREVIREANASQVTMFTVSPKGSAAGYGLSPENAEGGAGPAGSVGLDQVRDLNYSDPIYDMAEGTGGRAIVNTANLDETLAEAARDFDVYYSLGYRPAHGGDGNYHKLEVRVKEPRLKVRHRSGYLDKPEIARVADRTFSSLLIDAEANPLGVVVEFGEAEKAGRKRYEVPVLIRIPFDQVTFLPQGASHEGRLRFFVVVRDDEGRTSDLQEIPYPLTLTADQLTSAAGREIGYVTKLLLREGTPKVAIGVWDELSGEESFVHKSVLVDGRG